MHPPKRTVFATPWKWRLDEMLLKKADNNVSVYILLYFYETQFAMDLGSKYSMAVLNNHSNIEVHRHPDMLSGAIMKRWLLLTGILHLLEGLTFVLAAGILIAMS